MSTGPPTQVASDRLGELLELVLERNPFQRARLEQLGLSGQPRLTDLPPLSKRELVEDQARHPQFGTNLTYPIERYTQLWQTSGTTGPPLRVLDTPEDWAWWRELFAHTLTVAGVARRATAWGSPSRSARTSSSGRRTRGSRRSAPWRWRWAA